MVKYEIMYLLKRVKDQVITQPLMNRRDVYMEKGTYLMENITDINRFQNKRSYDKDKRILFIDVIKQQHHKCRYTANITKIFAKTGYCKIKEVSEQIWFQQNNITNISNMEWTKLTVGTTIKSNIINQRNQLKAINIEIKNIQPAHPVTTNVVL